MDEICGRKNDKNYLQIFNFRLRKKKPLEKRLNNEQHKK